MRLIFLLLWIAAEAHLCYFTPPKDWEIAHLKNPSPHVQIGFIGKGSTEFRPSINLATEEVDVPLKEYVKAVKELNQSDPSAKWRDLGKFQTKAGAGHLIEITNTIAWGEVKVFQAFFVQNHTAYILTAAVLKQDLPKLQAEILQSLQSLSLASEIWSPIADASQQSALKDLLSPTKGAESKQKAWEKLQAEVQSHAELGPYWQFLALKQGRAALFPTGDSP